MTRKSWRLPGTTLYGVDGSTVSTTARHTWDVPLSAITPAWLKRNAVLCILYPLSTWSAKIAIFVLYLRLFGRAKWVIRSCWAGIVSSTILYWTCTVLLSVYSFPHRGQHWDLSLGMKIQKDPKIFAVWLVVGSFNLFLDVFLLVLPMPIVMGLKMSLQKRIGLAAVFLTGIVYVPPSYVFISTGCMTLTHLTIEGLLGAFLESTIVSI